MENQEKWKSVFDKYQRLGYDTKPSIFAQEIIEYIKGKNKLLELGAGLGQDSKYFYDNGFSVTCTDASDYALTIAKEKIGIDHAVYVQVNLAEALPFENESYDVVYSHLALQYFDKITTDKLFKDIHRILKPGGILAAFFNSTDDPEIKEKHFRKIEENYYQEGEGLKKRYFCLACLDEFASDLFDAVIADNLGRTYKNNLQCIRYVGVKK